MRLEDCPQCGGYGCDTVGWVCPTCEGHGYIMRELSFWEQEAEDKSQSRIEDYDREP